MAPTVRTVAYADRKAALKYFRTDERGVPRRRFCARASIRVQAKQRQAPGRTRGLRGFHRKKTATTHQKQTPVQNCLL
jgi:hypothetical protein